MFCTFIAGKITFWWY